jgi:hypothetical protein
MEKSGARAAPGDSSVITEIRATSQPRAFIIVATNQNAPPRYATVTRIIHETRRLMPHHHL